jgi:hypothetical protein
MRGTLIPPATAALEQEHEGYYDDEQDGDGDGADNELTNFTMHRLTIQPV